MNHSPNPEMVIANRKNFNFTSEDLQDFLLKYHEHMMKNKTFMNAINGSSNGTNPHATDNSCDDYCDNSAMRQIFDDYKHDIHGYVTLAVSFFFRYVRARNKLLYQAILQSPDSCCDGEIKRN